MQQLCLVEMRLIGSLVPRLSPCANDHFYILQSTESWVGPGNEAS